MVLTAIEPTYSANIPTKLPIVAIKVRAIIQSRKLNPTFLRNPKINLIENPAPKLFIIPERRMTGPEKTIIKRPTIPIKA